MTTQMTPEPFPFPDEPLGAVPGNCPWRQENDPLGDVTLPSGDVVRLAVRFDDVVAVLTNSGFSRDLTKPGCPRLQKGADIADQRDTLINMDAPRHTRVRRILAGPFAARRVEKWRPRIRQIAMELAGRMRAQGTSADLVAAYAEQLPIRVIAEMLGVAGADLDKFRYFSAVSMTIGPESEGERAIARQEFMTELLPTEVRALGIGAWNNATVAIFGGTAPLVNTALAGAGLSQLFFSYVAVAAVIGFFVIRTLPETKGAELA